MKTLDIFPVTEGTLSFEKFVSLTEEERAKIEEVRILPPRLGRSGFGKIIVKYKTPIYKHKLWQTSTSEAVI